MTILLQEVKCPHCRSGWDLQANEIVTVGETLTCRFGCGTFTASPETVLCCTEDVHGMVQLSLRQLPD